MSYDHAANAANEMQKQFGEIEKALGLTHCTDVPQSARIISAIRLLQSRSDALLTMLHRLYDNVSEVRDIHGNPMRYEIEVMDYEALERVLYPGKEDE